MLIEKREKNGELTFIEQNLRDTIIELQNAINRSVPYRAASDYYYSSSVYGATRGLAVWLPASNEEFKEHIDRYKRSRLYRFDIRRAREENREGWVSFNEYIHSKDGFQGLGSLDSR
jgi:hypothetical protein